MKIKEIASLLLAAAVISLTASAVYADEVGAEDATYCFDTSYAVSQWETYGSSNEVGLAYDSSSEEKESGSGALCVSENITEDIDASLRFGGVYILSDSLGLDDFGGCTIQMSVKFDKDAANLAEAFTVFSDGVIWITSTAEPDSSNWTQVSLTVPSNASNTRFGFSIPIYTQYSGTVFYIDNVIVYDSEGNAISNVGDYQIGVDETTTSTGMTEKIILFVVVIILLVIVICGIGYIVSNFLKRFT